MFYFLREWRKISSRLFFRIYRTYFCCRFFRGSYCITNSIVLIISSINIEISSYLPPKIIKSLPINHWKSIGNIHFHIYLTKMMPFLIWRTILWIKMNTIIWCMFRWIGSIRCRIFPLCCDLLPNWWARLSNPQRIESHFWILLCPILLFSGVRQMVRFYGENRQEGVRVRVEGYSLLACSIQS